MQSQSLATELVQKLTAAALAGLIGSLTTADIARAAETAPPPASPPSPCTLHSSEFPYNHLYS